MQDISFADFAPQGSTAELLQKQLAQGNFPHAVLIHGMPGVGKKTLGKLLVQALLCRQEPRPCGRCSDCQLAEKLEHPNLTVIRPGEPIAPGQRRDRTTIPVDDIRELVRICGEHTLDSGNRAVLILEADKMTPQAQNALLKTLEEPPAGTYFILVTEHLEGILTTVISRCQRVTLHPWEEDRIRDILIARGIDAQRAKAAAAVSEGSIGRAVQDAEDEAYWRQRKEWSSQFLGLTRHGDILTVSNAWKDRKNEADALLDYLEEQFRLLLRHRLDPRVSLISDEIPAAWRTLADRADLNAFSRLMDLTAEARRQKEANVNFQAVAERLLFGMLGELSRWQK